MASSPMHRSQFVAFNLKLEMSLSERILEWGIKEHANNTVFHISRLNIVRSSQK